MNFLDHCRQSEETFGNAYSQVHEWLDALAGKAPHGMRHRRFRHHEAGIAEVRALWGDQAAEAARQHVEADLAQEGWKPGMPFPKDERDYVRMGFF